MTAPRDDEKVEGAVEGAAEYTIGYGKPPLASRFKKGHSGNPKGRPKDAKNRATILKKILEERVVVTDNGRRKRITKQEAVYKQLVNKAASGDARSAQLLFAQIHEIEGRIGSSETGREIVAEIDQQVFQNFLKRMRNSGGEDGEDSETDDS